jgi:ABC-2 type transport system ATP-binding protein
MDKAIEVKDLSRHFGDFKAVDKINFHVNKGEIFGFLGANGAGKTTAIKMLTGILEHTSGSAIVAGCDIEKEKTKLKYKIGYMSQKFSLYENLTLKENINFYGGIYGLKKDEITKRRNEMLEKLDIRHLENTLIREIPLGWRQKLAFSVAILHKPEVVFLDEPTSGVDPVTRRQFWDMIYEAAESGITAFVTTHYMDEAEYCDRICMMVNGKVAAYGTLKELLEQNQASDMDEVFLKLAR